MYALVYVLLLGLLYPAGGAWHPSADHVEELVAIAMDVDSTDATEGEAVLLATVCVHESHCRLKAVGDSGKARGPWQVRGQKDVGAGAALAKVRWSYGVCGDLSLYAGCGRCGACPEIVKSLEDPTLPRR